MTDQTIRPNLPQPAAYLVMLKSTLVATDLALTLADHAPDGRIIRAARTAEATVALERVSRVAVAFLELHPVSFTGSVLERMIVARGGRTILIGDAAEAMARGPGWTLLMRPFSTEAVLAALRAAP